MSFAESAISSRLERVLEDVGEVAGVIDVSDGRQHLLIIYSLSYFVARPRDFRDRVFLCVELELALRRRGEVDVELVAQAQQEEQHVGRLERHFLTRGGGEVFGLLEA